MSRCILLAVVVLVSGCVHYGSSDELSRMPGIDFSEGVNGYKAITAVAFNLPGVIPNADSLGLCLAENVRADGVDLIDSSRSYVGRYSGIYREVENRREAGSENSLKYVSKSGGQAVARGRISYTYNSEAGFVSVPITKVIRFTLSVTTSATSNTYRFKDVESAQTDTGVVPNSGFGPFLDIRPTFPERGYRKLSELSMEVNRCLSRS